MTYPDIERLKKTGYTVVQKSPWHYQVVGKKAVVNIWPTARKYMREYGSGASVYTDVVTAVQSILKPKKKAVLLANEMYAASMTPAREEAIDIWRIELSPVLDALRMPHTAV